jgi:hypothetical protein
MKQRRARVITRRGHTTTLDCLALDQAIRDNTLTDYDRREAERLLPGLCDRLDGPQETRFSGGPGTRIGCVTPVRRRARADDSRSFTGGLDRNTSPRVSKGEHVANTVEAAFTAYTKLTAEEKREFRAMMTGYELRTQSQSNAGKKAAATKNAGKSKTAPAGSES